MAEIRKRIQPGEDVIYEVVANPEGIYRVRYHRDSRRWSRAWYFLGGNRTPTEFMTIQEAEDAVTEDVAARREPHDAFRPILEDIRVPGAPQ